jgi:hypothetical protein
MLNREVLARDPGSYRLADGGVAKVSFPPDADQKAILREQLQTFVCKGAYADAIRRILDAFNAAAGRKADTPAAWVSGFYGSGKSLLAVMLGALWTDLVFDDGATAEGLVHSLPPEVRAGLRELRANGKRLGGLIVGGGALGIGSQHPVKAVLEVILRAVGLPGGTDMRPSLVALWLAKQGILDDVRSSLGDDFEDALREFLLDDRLAVAAWKAKPDIAADADTLMDRLGKEFEREPEPTVELLVEKAQQALTINGKDIPLTLIILDEVQQFIREDNDISLTIQIIAEQLASKFKGRVLLVCTGQSALGDTRYLEKLLGRFPLQIPLGSADIDSVVRETVLLKRDTAKPDIAKMLDARSGEIDKHLQGSKLARTEADRANAVADWPILSTRRKLWERVMAELDKSGLGATLRGQLRLTLDAAKQYGDSPLGVAVPADFLFDTFAAEALSRNLISREIYDRIAILRAEAGDGGPLKARILVLVYLLTRIAGDAHIHGVRATPEVIADLLIEDLANAAPVRVKVPDLLTALFHDGAVIEISGEWRLQTKESADWQAAFNQAQAQEISDAQAIARSRGSFLDLAIDEALTGAGQVSHGASKTSRKIERVVGSAQPSGDGLVLRLWNGWDHGLNNVLNEIRAADVTKDATLHLVIAEDRKDELQTAIVTYRAATSVLQRQGVPTTDGGKEAKAAMQSRLERAEQTAKAILRDAMTKAQVFVAGGAEVGAGMARADAVKDAALRVLDRLYPDFGAADVLGWDRVINKAKVGVPDAIKEVGHQGEPKDHPVCKAFLRAIGASRRGSDLRNIFAAPPYGWPKDAVDAAMVVLANDSEVRVTSPDHKPLVLAKQPVSQWGTYTFVPENIVVSTTQRIAVRAIGNLVGLTSIAAGEEGNFAISIVDKLAAIASDSGGDAPAPAAPEVPGIADLHAASGNALLVALAARLNDLKVAVPQWQAAKVEKDRRLRDWSLVQRLIGLGAENVRDEAEAIRAGRSLLSEPNPLPTLVSAAADDLRSRANAGYSAWQTAWNEGEARLKADPAWNKLDPDKRRQFRVDRHLLQYEAPDLSTPQKISESLSTRGLTQWHDMAAALPSRVENVLQDAAIELEPKTQKVPIPKPSVMKSVADLDTWLEALRAAIAPLLNAGPVLPTA